VTRLRRLNLGFGHAFRPLKTLPGKISFFRCRIEARWSVVYVAKRCGFPCSKEFTMKYMLLLYANEAGFQTMTKTQADQTMAAYGAYTEALKKAGVWLGSNRLRPTGSATTVRVADGKTNVLNGPYVETKEQLGGYYMIDVSDLDAALSWAARCPGASHGTVEVRPIWEM
jgi:hypothetical protein